MDNSQLDKIAIEIINLLANEKLPICYLENVFNHVESIVKLETVIKKIDL